MTSNFDNQEQRITPELHQTYSEVAADHAMNPMTAGSIAGADGFVIVIVHLG